MKSVRFDMVYVLKIPVSVARGGVTVFGYLYVHCLYNCAVLYCIAGYYMYIEASSPHTAGDNAYLRTIYRYTADGRNKCLHLW